MASCCTDGVILSLQIAVASGAPKSSYAMAEMTEVGGSRHRPHVHKVGGGGVAQ